MFGYRSIVKVHTQIKGVQNTFTRTIREVKVSQLQNSAFMRRKNKDVLVLVFKKNCGDGIGNYMKLIADTACTTGNIIFIYSNYLHFKA